MRSRLKHITLFLIAAVFSFAMPQASAQTFGGTPIKNTATLRYSVNNGQIIPRQSNTATIVVESFPLMTLEKSVSAAVVPRGEEFSFRIVVTNTGNVSLKSIEVYDTLDASFRNIRTDKGSIIDGVLIWPVEPIRPRTSDSVTITVGYVDAPAGTKFTNIAHAFDEDAPSVNASASFTTAQAGSFSVYMKKRGPALVTPLDTVDYTISVQNDGALTLYRLNVLDTIRAPMRIIGASDGATVNGNVLEWTPARINVGDSVTFRVRVAFDAVTSARQITNTAHLLTSSRLEDDLSRDAIIQSSTVTTILEPPRTDMSLSKSVSRPVIALNDTATYTITARNTGNRILTQVGIIDTVDPTLFTVDTVYPPGVQPSANIVAAVFDTLLPDQAGHLSFKVRTLATIADQASVINTATATAHEIPGRMSASAIVAITDTTSVTAPSITFAKFGPSAASSRDTVEYVISVQNTGATALRDAVIRDTLDTGMALVSASDSALVTGTIVTWPLGSIQPGQLKSVTIRVTFPTLSAPRVFTNRAGFFAYRSVPASAFVNTTVTPAVVSLGITKSASADTVLRGSAVEYTIRVQNSGTTPLTNVTVTDTLTQAWYDAVTVSPGATFTDSVMSAVFPVIEPGAFRTVSILATLRPDLVEGTVLRNIAHAAATETGAADTDTATVFMAIPPYRALSFTKVASKDSALFGSQVTYTFHVTNTGNVPLRNILVTDTLQDNVFDRSIILFPGVDRQGNVITAFFDSLRPGETDSAYFRLRLLTDLPSPTVVTNTAYAIADSLIDYEPSSATLVGYESISLHLTKTASADTVSLGGTFFYVIRVENNGSKDLSNVVVTDTIPSAYVTPVSVITNGSLTGNVVQSTFADLWAGDAEEIVVQVRARTDTTAQPAIVNRAFATSDETGPDPVVALATITTFDPTSGQVDQPLLYLGKSVSTELVAVGDDVSYMLLVRNAGNVTLRDVLVIDTIPGVLSAVQVSEPGTVADTIARWILDSLTVGESRTFTIAGTVPEGVAHRTRVINQAYGSSAQTPQTSSSASFTAIIPIADQSCRIHLQVAPRLVIGNGLEAAVFEAFVSDTLGRPKPDGTPVVFRTPTGFFSNGLDSIIVPTVNGIARDSLRALISSGSIARIDVTVSVEDPGVCSAQEIVQVVFYPGAIAGVVLDNLTRDPYEGAVVIVYNPSGDLIGTVTTGPDGSYLIPVPQTDTYTVVIITTDRFGQPITTTTTVVVEVPGTGGIPPVMTRNMITGKIYFYVSDKPIVAQRLKVVLVSEAPNAPGSASDDGERITVLGAVDSTITDSTGTYIFNNVLPGTYTVKVDHPYLGGTMVVGTINPGQTIVDANIPIVLNQQLGLTKSGPAAALQRDTVTYTIGITNTGTFSLDSVIVTDSLDAAMEFISATAPAGMSFVYDPTAHQVIWNVGRMDSTGGPFTAASMSVTVRFADSISVNQTLTNAAFATGSNISPRLGQAVATAIVRPEIRLTKTALKRVVEIGNVATYTLAVTNAMPTFPVTDVVIEDLLPLGFSYAAGSSFIDSVRITDPAPSRLLRWSVADTLRPGETVTLTYKTIIGAGALEGNGINTAEAFALSASRRMLRSGPVEERVDVRAGIFADRGLIIGKVFFDENRNAYQDSGEAGVKDIEIMTSTGLRVITGDDGKYSIPDVRPGEHVLRVRERSLPPGAALLEGYNDFAGDARSRFVQVTPSGIARADFYLFQTIPDTVILTKTIAKAGAVTLTRWTDPMNLVFIEDERRAPMKLTGVNFEVARADLREEAAPALGELAEIMREYPDVSLLIVGHTDTMQIRTLTFPNNMVLSLARANAVKQFLFGREGIDSSRIRTLGLGELQPIAWNRTREGRAVNRRVEFFFNDDYEPKPLTVASILMQIAVEYDGSVPARSIRFTDKLDQRVRFVPGSGLLGDSIRIEPTSHNGEIHWTIPNPGKRFSEVLTYRVEIDKPDNEVLSAWTTTRNIIIETDSGFVESDTTISTVNHVAVAVRGRAANYVMSGILFRVGSAELRPAALSALDGVAEYLRNDPTATLVVEGHTDATPVRGGRYNTNVELSRARAESVVDILLRSYGISRSRMQAFGFGALRPVATNETPDGRERNRRVELRLYKQEFSSSVIQAGRIDSSHATVARLMPSPLLDDGVHADTVHPGEFYRLTLSVTRPYSSKTASLTIVDSLPSAMRLVDRSLEALNGISSATGRRVIKAVAEPRATEMTVTFVVEITETMLRRELLHHEFYAVRTERTGDIIVDKHTVNGNGSRITAEK